MPALCLCFVVHEPYRLRHYTVFDIGQSSVYEDDDRNCDILLHTARVCYLPMNDLMLKLMRRYGKDFRVTYCISGTALDQFEQYAPEVLDSFKAIADTGCAEFASETAPHSLAFLYSREEFVRQVDEQTKRIKQLFGKKPTTYRNAELVYNNAMGVCLDEMGFKTVLTEGAEHVLGWRSPNYVYNAMNLPNMNVLLRNTTLSGDLGRRFHDHSWNQWPLTADKYASWIHSQADAEVINIFNDYHVFGLRNPADSGIFAFMEALPEAVLANKNFSFATVSEISKSIKSVGEIDVPDFMSWDDGRDLNAWLGNDMQKDAIHSIYALTDKVRSVNDPILNRDFERLQTADHFHNMSTRWFSSFVPDRPNPFPSPYDAYIDYMNILADFGMRVNEAYEKPGARVDFAESAGHKSMVKKAAAAKARIRRTVRKKREEE